MHPLAKMWVVPLVSLALFVLLPTAVFAETQSADSATAKGYCPDASKIFKGSIYHTDDGKPWIEVVVDPDFQAKMTKERSLGTLPLTPIYDLVVRVKPEFNYYCIPGWAGNAFPVTADNLPKTVPIRGSLVFGPKDEPVVSSTVFSRTDVKDEQGRFVYEWKIKGWQNGIASEDKMERLIAGIAKGQSPSVTLAMTQSDGTKRNERGDAPLGLCAPVWGSGAHRAVYDRVAHRLSDFIYQADSIIFGGFLKIDPFKAEQKEFSHILNLRNYKGTPWSEIQKLASAGTLPLFSDCGEGIQIAISPLVSVGDFAAALQGGKFIYAASDVERRITKLNVQLKKTNTPPLFELPFSLIVLHEFGHVFAGLADEYLKAKGFYLDSWNGRNCRSVPKWAIDVKEYGNRNYAECSSDTLNRPSQKSLMRGAQSGSTFFNVVSCGYIIAAIKGGTGQEYWQECMNPAWNTIKPTGTSASVELYFASAGQAFMKLFGREQSLGAVDSALSGAKDGPSINVEYFSEDGTITGNEYPLLHTVDMSANLVAPSAEEESTSATPDDSVPEMSTTEPYVGKAASGVELTRASATPAFQAGDKVKVVVPTPPAHPADFEPLQQGEQVNGPEQCLDATGKQSFSQNPAPFTAQWGQEALCAQDVARATTLSETITHLEQSIATVQTYLDAILASAEEVSKLPSLDGIAVSLIPTGEDSFVSVGEVKKVGLQCVAGVSAPIGTAALSKVRAYVADSPTIGKEVQAAKQKVTERYSAFRKEPEKNKGTVTGATLDRLSDLKALLKSNFIMVTAASAVKLSAHAPLNTIPLSATLVRGADGAAKQCTAFAWGMKTKLFIGGVKGDFVVSNVTFDGRTFEQDCIPEAFLLGEFKEGLARNLAYYQAKKTEYEALLPPLKRELASLESTGYSCVNPKGGTVARKSIISSGILEKDTTATSTAAFATTTVATTPGFFNRIWKSVVGAVKGTANTVVGTVSDVVSGVVSKIVRKSTVPAPASGTPLTIRTLVLDTLGKPASLLETGDGVFTDKSKKVWDNNKGTLTDTVSGQTWDVEYEQKGHSRYYCNPPVLNIKFDNGTKKARKPLFNGRSTYGGFSTLGYQKIRLIPDCDIFDDRWSNTSSGFANTVNVLLRESVIYETARAVFGLPAVDVASFGDITIKSSDVDGAKPHRYMLLQRDNEEGDQIPFMTQFGLRPDLVEASDAEETNYQKTIVPDSFGGNHITNITYNDLATKQKKLIELDPENAIRISLFYQFVSMNDHFAGWNEDYGLDGKSGLGKIIPYDFDLALQCKFNSPQSIKWQINAIPPERQAEYEPLALKVSREIFGTEASLNRMMRAVDSVPFNVEKEKLKSFLRIQFYNFSAYFGSREFADAMGAPYTPFSLESPLLGVVEQQKAQADFLASCKRPALGDFSKGHSFTVLPSPTLTMKRTEREGGVTETNFNARFEIEVQAGSEPLKLSRNFSFETSLRRVGVNAQGKASPAEGASDLKFQNTYFNIKTPSNGFSGDNYTYTIPAGEKVVFSINSIHSETAGNGYSSMLSDGKYQAFVSKVLLGADTFKTLTPVFTNTVIVGNRPFVDIKMNGSDTPAPVAYDSVNTLSWTSFDATSCSATGDAALDENGAASWAEQKDIPTSFSDLGIRARIKGIKGGVYKTPLVVGITCVATDRSQFSDEVRVEVLPPPVTVSTTPRIGITSIIPQKGPVGTELTLSGSGLPSVGSLILEFLSSTVLRDFQVSYKDSKNIKFVVPNSLKPGSYSVDVFSESLDPFGTFLFTVEVSKPISFSVLSPKQDEIFNAGALDTVEWRSENLPPDAAVRISLIRGRATTTALTNQLIQSVTTPNDGQENWLIPSSVTPGYFFVQVECTEKSAVSCTPGVGGVFRVVGATGATPSEDSVPLSVDLKVNGSDKPPAVLRGSTITLSWTSKGAYTCSANWPVVATKKVLPVAGTQQIFFDAETPKIYLLNCYDASQRRTASDSVVVTPI